MWNFKGDINEKLITDLANLINVIILFKQTNHNIKME